MPLLQIQPKFKAEANRMITSGEAAEEVQHVPQKSATWPNYFGSMVKMANQGLKLASVTPPPGPPALDQLLLSHQFLGLGDGRSDPVSLAQFLRLPNKWMG